MPQTSARDAAVLCAALLLLPLAGCNSDIAATPVTGTIERDAEFEQADVPAWQTKREVSVTLRSANGRTSGIRVDWAAQDGGTVNPAWSRTDSAGVARTTWTLGDSSAHTVMAKAKGFAQRLIRSNARFVETLPLDRYLPLVLSTYDGSGETVHPDYLQISDPALRGRFLAITPYKGGSTFYENPSVYTSSDDVRWDTPQFGRNPVALPTQRYLSDPDLVYDPIAREILMYYREVGAEENTIWLMRTTDASKWTPREAVVSGPNHEVVSPSVVRRSADEWLMWVVNSHSGCGDAHAELELRRSTDGRHWSEGQTLEINQNGLMPWHVEVQWVPSRNEYWALYNAKSPGSCNTKGVYLATSPDGVTWTTYPSPVIAAGATRTLNDIVYRSTFAYEENSDAITFWFSGARWDGGAFVWGTVAQRRRRADVFLTIAKQPPLFAAPNMVFSHVPQLKIAP